MLVAYLNLIIFLTNVSNASFMIPTNSYKFDTFSILNVNK